MEKIGEKIGEKSVEKSVEKLVEKSVEKGKGAKEKSGISLVHFGPQKLYTHKTPIFLPQTH